MPSAGSISIMALACLPAVFAFAGPITENVAPQTSPESFQVMTPAESEEHRAKMAELTGEARERYRNEQYRRLRERAQAQGYELPETPPWGRTDLLPSTMPPTLHQRPAADLAQGDTADMGRRRNSTQAPSPLATTAAEDQAATPTGEPPNLQAQAPPADFQAHVEKKHVASRSNAAEPYAAGQPRADQPASVTRPTATEPPNTGGRPQGARSGQTASTLRAPRDSTQALAESASEAHHLARREAVKKRFDAYMAKYREAPAADPLGADTAAMELGHDALTARRKAMQARIDQAIEAMGQPRHFRPDHLEPHPRMNYPPVRRTYHPGSVWPPPY